VYTEGKENTILGYKKIVITFFSKRK